MENGQRGTVVVVAAAAAAVVARVTVVAKAVALRQMTAEISVGELPELSLNRSRCGGGWREAEMGFELPTRAVRSCLGNLRILEGWWARCVAT